jgi:hypothetical protein
VFSKESEVKCKGVPKHTVNMQVLHENVKRAALEQQKTEVDFRAIRLKGFVASHVFVKKVAMRGRNTKVHRLADGRPALASGCSLGGHRRGVDGQRPAEHARQPFSLRVGAVLQAQPAAGVALATSIAHKGAVAGAKVLAASLIEIFANPAIVQEAKKTFAEELGDSRWFSLLPKDHKPPVDLNRATMERYRESMRAHYIKERPRFL